MEHIREVQRVSLSSKSLNFSPYGTNGSLLHHNAVAM